MILGIVASALQRLMLPVGPADPYWANVVALLYFDGVDGSTVFPDERNPAHVFSPLANSPAITASNSVFGGGALQGGSIQCPASTDFNLGSTYTIEGFVKSVSMAGGFWNVFDSRGSGKEGVAIALGSTYSRICLANNSAIIFETGASYPVNTWFHIALVHYSGVSYLYQDGVLVGRVADARTLSTNPPLTFGSSYTGGQHGFTTTLLDTWRVTVGVARYTSNYTPATEPFPSNSGDPYWSSVASLLHFDGGNGSTTFTDETGKTWTGNGAAQISTAQSVFGGSSLRLNGSGTISTASSADFAYGTGDFSWECRVRFDSLTGNQYIIDHGVNGGTLQHYGNLSYYNPSAGVLSGPTLVANTWYAIAVVRVGGLTTLRVDGVVVSLGVDGHNYGAQKVTIGEYGGGGYRMTGYIDEFRITRGIARYTSDFAPPTQPFPNT